MTSGGTEPDAEQESPTRRHWWSLAILAAGLGMMVLDGTIVGVALPDIVADIGLSLTDAQWVNSLYAVILAALLLVAGGLADRLGRKRVFVVGVVLFVLGSLLAVAARGPETLIAARAVQAIGASLVMPSTLSTVNALFRGRYRVAAFGVWGAVMAGAAAIGPLAGGALTHWGSWHWIFLVNLPVGVIILVAALLVVPDTRGARAGGIDVLGVVLSAIGFGALVFGVIEGPDLGWWAPSGALEIFGWAWPSDAPISAVPIALAVGVLALVGFVLVEDRRRRRGRPVLLDLRLFTLRTFSWGNVTAATVAIGEFAIVFVLPLYLVNVLGLGVLGAGFVVAAMALGAFVSGASARHVAARVGAAGTVTVGLALEVLGSFVLALIINRTTPGWLVAIPLVAYGFGLGLASAQLTGTVLRDVPVEASGQGSATQSMFRQLGSAFGTAVSGAVLSLALAITLPTTLASAGVTGAAADQLADATRRSAGTTVTQLRDAGVTGPFGANTPAVADALATGFATATRASLLVAVGFLLLGFVGAVQLRRASR